MIILYYILINNIFCFNIIFNHDKKIKERNLNKNNKTPLHIASEKDSIKIGEILISAGANINAKDIIYQNIIYSFLIINIEIKEWNLIKNNETPLHIALLRNSTKIGEILILKGADINAKTIIYQNIK